MAQDTGQEFAKRRFFAKTKLSTITRKGMGTPCLEWTASGQKRGYGQFWFNGGYTGSHRFAWMLERGEIPPGLCVCHRCDNPKCVEVGHMFLGTMADNRRDCMGKGRHPHGATHWMRTRPERIARGDRNGSRLHPERLPRGERHWSKARPELVRRGESHHASKLTEADVRNIKKARDGGVLVRVIATTYGVCIRTIECILYGETWKHVPVNSVHNNDNGEQ